MTSQFETNVQSLEIQVRAALEDGAGASISQVFDRAQPADIADVLERMPDPVRQDLFHALGTARGAKVLHELGREATRQLINEMHDADVARYLDTMPMDEVADILGNDVPQRREALLAAMQPSDAREVRDLIGYPEESAGRLMTEKFVQLSPEMRIADVLDYLPQVDVEVETLTDLFIVGDGRELLGIVSLRDIVTTTNRQTLVRDVMRTDLVTVTPETDQEDAAHLVARYDFLALPVVSDAGRLLGIITVDDVIDVLIREETEDLMRYSAVEDAGLMDQPYFTAPIWRFVRARIGWLLILFVGQSLTGSVLRTFENELETLVTLSFFIPLLIGTGGNTGAQIVSTVIRGVALKHIQLRDTVKVMMRELVSGLLLGAILGVAGILYALVWGQVDFRFALVVGLTVVAICTWSNTVGAVIPLMARRFGIDPAVVSAPLITTLVDSTGLLIYMLIAKALLDVI